MSSTSRKYRKTKRHIDRIKAAGIQRVRDKLIVDAGESKVSQLQEAGYFSADDYEVKIDSGFNEVSILYECLSRNRIKSKRLGLAILDQLAQDWIERLERNYSGYPWTIFILDEDGVLTLYFFNRIIHCEGAERIYHSGLAVEN